MGDMSMVDQTVTELRQNHPDFRTSQRLAMLKPITAPALFTQLTEKLHKAGLTE